ncbi:MAG TPA: EamA family transporter [Gemmatimonadaceae bacterium]|nr:EamA family transporter [Gemmatimonadaceae bacterium]
MADVPATAPSRARILAAYATVYVVWGSTYLAIRYAIQTLPPFLMAAVRFLIAGLLLLGWARLRGAPWPARGQWRNVALVGAFLLFGGNGAVVWAEQRVPSGVTALLVATLPLWMVVLEWLGPERRRPSGRGLLGVLLGIVGIIVLVGPGALVGSGNVDLVGAGVLVLGSLLWGIGSLVSKHADMPGSPQISSALQMLAGGALLLALGLAAGEAGQVALGAVSGASLAGLLYLIVFGSLLGFTAFAWLLRVEPPSRVATYAYVNPVVAVLLGWAIAGEPVTASTLVAAAVIVGAVALIVSRRRTPAAGMTDGAPPAVQPTKERRRRARVA